MPGRGRGRKRGTGEPLKHGLISCVLRADLLHQSWVTLLFVATLPSPALPSPALPYPPLPCPFLPSPAVPAPSCSLLLPLLSLTALRYSLLLLLLPSSPPISTASSSLLLPSFLHLLFSLLLFLLLLFLTASLFTVATTCCPFCRVLSSVYVSFSASLPPHAPLCFPLDQNKLPLHFVHV